MSTWQPIESAPLDGETLLLWCPADNAVVIGRWVIEDEEEDSAIGWCEVDGADIDPSHWQPLPDAPKGQ